MLLLAWSSIPLFSAIDFGHSIRQAMSKFPQVYANEVFVYFCLSSRPLHKGFSKVHDIFEIKSIDESSIVSLEVAESSVVQRPRVEGVAEKIKYNQNFRYSLRIEKERERIKVHLRMRLQYSEKQLTINKVKRNEAKYVSVVNKLQTKMLRERLHLRSSANENESPGRRFKDNGEKSLAGTR